MLLVSHHQLIAAGSGETPTSSRGFIALIGRECHDCRRDPLGTIHTLFTYCHLFSTFSLPLLSLPLVAKKKLIFSPPMLNSLANVLFWY